MSLFQCLVGGFLQAVQDRLPLVSVQVEEFRFQSWGIHVCTILRSALGYLPEPLDSQLLRLGLILPLVPAFDDLGEDFRFNVVKLDPILASLSC